MKTEITTTPRLPSFESHIPSDSGINDSIPSVNGIEASANSIKNILNSMKETDEFIIHIPVGGVTLA